jgi:hypothetical protein
MIKSQTRTTYSFSTPSEGVAKAIEILSQDQSCREMVFLFARIEGSKRRNTLLRVARHLINTPRHH